MLFGVVGCVQVVLFAAAAALFKVYGERETDVSAAAAAAAAAAGCCLLQVEKKNPRVKHRPCVEWIIIDKK